MRILAIGDTHIPDRAEEIPNAIRNFISRGYDILAFTGDATLKNVISEIAKMSRAKKVYAVRGNMDYLNLPLRERFVAKLRFGLVHGHGIYPRGDRKQLEELAIEMDVDVLISGHTHHHDIYAGDVILLNPGSATGVWSGGNASMIPSAMCIEVSDVLRIELCLNGRIELYELNEV